MKIREFLEATKIINQGHSKKLSGFLKEQKPDFRSLNYMKLFHLICMSEHHDRRDEMLGVILEYGLPLFFDAQKLVDCGLRFISEHDAAEVIPAKRDASQFKTVFAILLEKRVSIDLVVKFLHQYKLPEQQELFLEVLNSTVRDNSCVYKELFCNYDENSVRSILQHLRPENISGTLNMSMRAYCKARKFNEISRRLPFLSLDLESQRLIDELAQVIEALQLRMEVNLSEGLQQKSRSIIPLRKKAAAADPVVVDQIKQKMEAVKAAIQRQAELDAIAEQTAKKEAAERKAARKREAELKAAQLAAEQRVAEERVAELKAAELAAEQREAELKAAQLAAEQRQAELKAEQLAAEQREAELKVVENIVFGDFGQVNDTADLTLPPIPTDFTEFAASVASTEEQCVPLVPVSLTRLFNQFQIFEPETEVPQILAEAEELRRQRQYEYDAWVYQQQMAAAAAAQYQWQMHLMRRPRFYPPALPAQPIEPPVHFGTFPPEGTMEEAEEAYRQRLQQR